MSKKNKQQKEDKEPIEDRFENVDEIILELRSGEGGDDSKNFVSELFSTYLKYAGNQRLRSELLHSDYGHVIAKITGLDAGKSFINESGKHIVQRIPETESKGRKQTSVVVVGILPIKSDTRFEPLKQQDLDITCQVGSGPGGQNKNKTASAVRMKHKPTGMSVFICNERSQQANKAEALSILTAKVNEVRLAEIDGDYAAIRKEQMADGGRGNKRRTYNFMRSKIDDHILNKDTSNVKAFMNGKFDVLFGE